MGGSVTSISMLKLKYPNNSIGSEEYRNTCYDIFNSNPETKVLLQYKYGKYNSYIKKGSYKTIYAVLEYSVTNNKINRLLNPNYRGEGKFLVPSELLDEINRMEFRPPSEEFQLEMEL